MRSMNWLAALVAAASLSACDAPSRPAQRGSALSDMPDAAPLDGSEYVLATQNGESVKVKVSDLQRFAQQGAVK
ncbi:hypothetical protein BH10PSE14_BH10PSE14_06860 [soil metagenome]